jgi:hypothetical protein
MPVIRAVLTNGNVIITRIKVGGEIGHQATATNIVKGNAV